MSGLSNGTAYTFRIRAVAGTVHGAASAEVTATLLAPVVEFSAGRYDGSEAALSRTVTVGVRATPSFSTATTVSYRVGGTASSGADFTALAGALSMTGGGGSLAVSILDDRVDEEAETIMLRLDAGSGYSASHGVQPQEGGARWRHRGNALGLGQAVCLPVRSCPGRGSHVARLAPPSFPQASRWSLPALSLATRPSAVRGRAARAKR